ncbi:MAG: ubiquinone/menaquinone biosynthesis methyltransferase [Polyangiales bacterium]
MIGRMGASVSENAPIAEVQRRAGSEAAHGDAVRAMFDRIAPTYDLLNRAMSAGLDVRWRRRAIDVLADAPAGTLLDLCAGTLDLAAALEAAMPARSIVAADFAADMLDRGRAKVRRTEIVVADALALPFEDEAFAGVINGFGLRNLADTEAGVREAARVLKPGGRLVFLEFFRPDRGPAALATRGFHALFARLVLPTAGAIVARDASAYAYLARSMASFLSRAELESTLRRHGFVDVVGEDLTLGVASIVSATKASGAA